MFTRNACSTCKRGNDAVAGAVPVQTEDMAGILAAQLPALLLQQFHHIAVAHLGALEWDAQFLQRMLERQIGHQRADHAAVQLALLLTMSGDHVEQLVAVIDLPVQSTIIRRSPSPSSAMPISA